MKTICADKPVSLYEQEELSRVTGGVLRPGGVALTTRTMKFCRLPAGRKSAMTENPYPHLLSGTDTSPGCLFDCGLCPEHGQHSTALIEVTSRCNLHCKVCFADAGGSRRDPSMENISFYFDRVNEANGPCNIQLSGGEPTVRDDLDRIISLGRDKGFSLIQLDTNGIRLAGNPDYARSLKEAGLSSVFLQFDGIKDEAHLILRGKGMAGVKKQAIMNCGEAGLGVVLVPTIVPGVNRDQIGGIIRYATRFAPTVRGVRFQPVSYFGRFPGEPLDSERITLPEIMEELAAQTGGEIHIDHFAPPACEHALCFFRASYLIRDDGGLQALGPVPPARCTSSQPAAFPPIALEARNQSASFTARQWAAPASRGLASPRPAPAGEDDLDRSLRQARIHTFSISGMAFQDTRNLNLESLQGCCIHVVAPNGRLIPFCTYNLTATTGKSLSRRGRTPC